MRQIKSLLFGALLLCVASLAFAQDTAIQTVTMRVMEICVLDVTGNPGSLNITAPTNGGDNPVEPFDESTYAQYTSVVAPGKTRNITANWESGDSAPSGCELRLQAQPAGGNQGTSAGEITISTTPQNIIIGIKSCATGRGVSSGAKLIYTLKVTDVESLVAGEEKEATITLTLTDDN